MECIICGKPAQIDLYCKECYIEKKLPPIEPFIYKTCKRCGFVNLSGVWKPPNQLKSHIEKKLEKNFESAVVDLEENKAYVSINNIDLEIPVHIKYEETLCNICKKISGGYYEGVIQLRGKAVRYLKQIIRLFHKLDNPYSLKELKEGIDIKFFSSKKAFEAVRELGLTYKVTRKLHTQIQGKRKYRITILVRE